MTALMHYLHAAHAIRPTLLDRIWERIRSAVSGPAYDLACEGADEI
jgi:hypothetical protein